MGEMMDFPETWEEFVEHYGICDKEEVYTNGSMLIPCFRVKQWLEHTKTTVVPLPCVRDERGRTRGQTIKMLFAKIDEELNELKAAVLREATCRNDLDEFCNGVDDDTDTDIAEEAADTITAITTMLEAFGIDAEMRNEAQRRVNEKNRKRGRL